MTKLRYAAMVVLLLASTGLIAACSMAGSTSSALGFAYTDQQVGPELSAEQLVAAVAPAVVSIVTERAGHDWFWHAVPQTGAGSGIVINPDGYIVTNNHVVAGVDRVMVTLSDGSAFEATTVGADAQTDLAVVRIEASNLDYLHFLGNSLQQLRVLDPVVAVGNALALPGGPTWTLGVVSNLGRSIQLDTGVVLSDLIQTDAAINGGNSGGPLINMAGQVVGINVAIASNAENIGFAISTDTAIPIVEALISAGKVARPWLGVTVATVTRTVQRYYNLSVDRGALVTSVTGGSPASRAGLQAGDVIVMIDDNDISSAAELSSAIGARAIGDRIELVYYRGNVQSMAYATLEESPA